MKIDNFEEKKNIFDVVIVGGGPSGMMSAFFAAKRGKKVLLLEKNNELGKKLKITGGGRCNLTNATFDIHEMLANYGKSAPFLYSPFSKFGVKDTIEFFNTNGCQTKVEDRNRVFPQSDDAHSVFNVLINGIKKMDVQVYLKACIDKFVLDQETKIIQKVLLKDGTEIRAKSFVIATGGMSHPETGSTGDGFVWLEELGHHIVKPKASLTPLIIKEDFVKNLQGVTLPNVKVDIFQNGNKQKVFEKVTNTLKQTGRLLFTHFGLSGPLILNMSQSIGEFLKYGEVKLRIDLVPQFAPDVLNKNFQEILKTESNKKVKNLLSNFVSNSIVDVVLEVSSVDSDTFAHSLTRDDRLRIVHCLKNFFVTVLDLATEEKAIVTSGGVSLEEIDLKEMRSKIINNLFVVGDMLDINRPSGGFSLQLCWTTGYIAGNNS